MHLTGCPKRTNFFASCYCEAIRQQEHNERLEDVKRKYLDEREIVNRIWTALRIKTFEEAGGKTIVEHVENLRHERDSALAELKKLKGAE